MVNGNHDSVVVWTLAGRVSAMADMSDDGLSHYALCRGGHHRRGRITVPPDEEHCFSTVII